MLTKLETYYIEKLYKMIVLEKSSYFLTNILVEIKILFRTKIADITSVLHRKNW